MLPVKIIILVFTTAVVSLSVYGVTQLEVEFKTEWFIKEGTYLRSVIDF